MGKKFRVFIETLMLFLLATPSCGRIWGAVSLNQNLPGGGGSGATPFTKVYVGGAFTTYNFIPEVSIARLNIGTGSLDGTFAPVGAGLNGGVNAMAVDSSGNITVGGGFTNYSGTNEYYVARIKPDGSLDGTFAPVGTGLNNQVNGLTLDSSGNAIVVGDFTQYNLTNEQHVARIKPDGSLDGTFAQTGAGLNGIHGYAVAIDSSGNILVGGDFTTYNGGSSEPYIVRLKPNGTLDATFGPTGLGLTGAYVWSMVIDSSGKIIVGGNLNGYNGTPEGNIVRLNSDGSLDNTFAPVGGGLNSTVYSIAIDSAGKFDLGGFFNLYTITAEPYAARLNTDGSPDGAFTQTGAGLSTKVNSLAVDTAGKIYVGGAFINYNGTSENFIARLNTDGSLDTTFSPTGVGLSAQVNSVLLIH